MQEPSRDNLLSLKVMRLTKPTIKPLLHVTNEEQDLPGTVFNNDTAHYIAATKGAELMTTGELLSLPQSFGSIYLGETFSCYVSILNDSNQNCREVSLKTDIQTTSQRFQLTVNKPKDTLSPDDSLDDVLNYEVKELGAHILICAVNYLSTSGEKLYMRRFYKFQVLKPLEVKTKFYNADSDEVFLEAQVQNITTSAMCMDHVILEPSQFYSVLPLNNWPPNKIQEDSNDDKNIFGSTYMSPMDMRQYLFKLIPKTVYIRELRSKPMSPIGKLDIVWRTNFGEMGRLQTSQLQRTAPAQQEVRLVLQEAPDTFQLEKQFELKCKLENSGSSKMEVKLFLTNPRDDSLLWCGVSGKVPGPLPSNAYLDLQLHAIAIKPGLLTIGGVRILDLNTTKVYEFEDICKIHVYPCNQSPFR